MLFGYICCGLLILLSALLSMIGLGIRDILHALRTKRPWRGVRGVVLLVIPVAVLAWLWHVQLGPAALCLQLPYRAPPSPFTESHLAGIWQDTYPDGGIERLTFSENGTFEQIFRGAGEEDSIEHAISGRWWLEHLPDGGVRAHLQGAWYYPQQMVVPDLEAAAESCPPDDTMCRHRYLEWPYAFFDPISNQPITMAGALVLSVRADLSGELLLHHMRTSSTQLIAIPDCRAEHFRRVDAP